MMFDRERCRTSRPGHRPPAARKTLSIQPLADAMRYAVLGGGKRIRPRLVYATGRLARAPLDMLDRAAAAVEFIHAYSLIHDDLPAMDDDDLRRGRPTVHIRFDQATAILAGDALQALAFEVVSDPSVDAATAQRWAKLLATAAGSRGMVGGQVMDLAGETRTLYHDELETLHRRKTGALLHAAVMMGAGAGSLAEADLEALGKFGAEIGLAFQIHDDVLDATAATTVLGKAAGCRSTARQIDVRQRARSRCRPNCRRRTFSAARATICRPSRIAPNRCWKSPVSWCSERIDPDHRPDQTNRTHRRGVGLDGKLVRGRCLATPQCRPERRSKRGYGHCSPKTPRLVRAEYWYTPPLYFAVREGHLDAVKLLVETGAELTHRSLYGTEPLLQIALDRDRHDVADYLRDQLQRVAASDGTSTCDPQGRSRRRSGPRPKAT